MLVNRHECDFVGSRRYLRTYSFYSKYYTAAKLIFELESPPIPQLESPPIPQLESPPIPQLESPPIPQLESPPIPQLESPPIPQLESPPIPQQWFKLSSIDLVGIFQATPVGPRIVVTGRKYLTLWTLTMGRPAVHGVHDKRLSHLFLQAH